MSSQTSVGRDVALIVLAGVALGLVHNGVGLATHPPRGIPWLAGKTVLPSLESLAPEDSATASTQGQNAAPAVEPPPSPAASSAPPAQTPDQGAARTARPTGAGAVRGSPTSSPPPDPAGGSHPAPAVPPATGSTAPPAPRPAAPLPFIPETGQPIQVELATVKRFFDARAALFLDARDAAEYEAGHIPGALRLTNSEAQNEPDRLKRLPVQGRPLIAYCEGGTCEASLDLARTLIEAGYRKVLVYMGGYPEWAAAGHPVERGSGGR